MRIRLESFLIPFATAMLFVVLFAAAGEIAPLAVIGGLAGIYVTAAVWRRSDFGLIAGFVFLIVMPFFLGVSRTPKIFLDEILLLTLLGVTALKFLTHNDIIRLRPMSLLWPLLCLAAMGLTLLYHRSGLVPIRSFLETFGLGVPLCLCLLSSRLATAEMAEKVAKTLCWVVAAVALIGLVEAAARYNPVMEYTVRNYADEYMYLSPELTASTGASYRPYVVFATPSEGATVVGLCLPFILALAVNNRRYRLYAGGALALGLAFVLVNATRGVWLALAVTGILFVPLVRKWATMLMPAALAGLAGLALFMSGSGFWRRITDLRHFEIRLWYWEQALLYYESDWLLGIGFGNFSALFSRQGPRSSVPVEYLADIQNISTVDNVFIMILVEQGLVGLLGFLFLSIFLFLNIYWGWKKLRDAGQAGAALYARAALAVFCLYLVCGCLADVHLFTKATKLMCMLLGIGWGVSLFAGEGGREARPPPGPGAEEAVDVEVEFVKS